MKCDQMKKKKVLLLHEVPYPQKRKKERKEEK